MICKKETPVTSYPLLISTRLKVASESSCDVKSVPSTYFNSHCLLHIFQHLLF